MNAQQDTKQLSSGSETEKAREGKIYFFFLQGWSEKDREREGRGGFYVKEGICGRCILCNEMPQFCSLKSPGAANGKSLLWSVPGGSGPGSPI